MAWKTICVTGARGIGMHIVSVLPSEIARPTTLKTSTKTAITCSSPRGDRDAMHTLSAYSIPQAAQHSSAVSGPTFDDCSYRSVRSASTSASSLNLHIATRSIAAKVKQQRGKHASLTEPRCHLEPLQTSAAIIPYANSHPIVELADNIY